MPTNEEPELPEPIGNDASDDPVEPDESEADLLVYCQCASEPCLGDWLSLLS